MVHGMYPKHLVKITLDIKNLMLCFITHEKVAERITGYTNDQR